MLPPMIGTEKRPDEIVDSIMNTIDRKALIRYLITFQKSNPSWDAFRKEISESLLEKFKMILHEARKHGFVRPVVRDERLVWDRIMGFKRNYQNADQCTLCDRSDKTGNCRGRMIYKRDGQTIFKPCWIKTG